MFLQTKIKACLIHTVYNVVYTHMKSDKYLPNLGIP